MPPGPLPIPIIGNVHLFPREKPWYLFERWGKMYNENLITVWIGRRPYVISNSAWAIHELNDKRSTIYSDRPRLVVAGELSNDQGRNQPQSPYNDIWRMHRKLTHLAVGSQKLREHESIQQDESWVLAHDFLTGKDMVMAIERYSSSVVSIIGWARRVDRQNDPVVQRALEFMHLVAQVFVPGDYWCETIPELSYLPEWIYKLPAEMKRGANMMVRYWSDMVKEAGGRDRESFSKYLLSDKVREQYPELNDVDIANLAANLIGGIADGRSYLLIDKIRWC